jgi:tetratricopeptide (TPR) repeat protein
MLGWLSFAQNDMAEAEHWWEKTIQIDSRSAAAANNLAWLYAQRNVNLDTALTLAQTAKAAYPTSAKANDTLGFVYYRKGLDTQAIYYAQQAIDLDPANPVFHYHLGLAYAQKGQDANARRALQHALDLKVNFDGAEDARRVLKTLIF